MICVEEADDLRIGIAVKTLTVFRGEAHGDDVLGDVAGRGEGGRRKGETKEEKGEPNYKEMKIKSIVLNGSLSHFLCVCV